MVTLSDISNWLKIRYIDNQAELNKTLLMAENSPLFKMMTMKKVKGEGDRYTHAIRGSQKKTSSRNFAAMQNRVKAGATGARETFTYKMVENYDEVRVGRQALLSSATNVGTFFNTVKDDVDQSVMSMNADILRALYLGSANGTIGRAAALGTKVAPTSSKDGSQVITLDTGSTNIMYFESGMYVEFASAAYTVNDLRKGGNAGADKLAYRIKEVDLIKNQITVILKNANSGTATSTNAAATAIGATDYMWKEGEYLMSGGQQLYGLNDFIPSSISSTDSFLGTNRSISRRRLAGYYNKPAATTILGPTGTRKGDQIYDAIVRSVVDALKHFQMYEFDQILVNPEVMKELQLSDVFRNTTRYIDTNNQTKRVGHLGYSEFNVLTASGPVPCVVDKYCPEDQIYGINKAGWMMGYLAESMGNIVNFRTEGNNKVFQVRDAPAIQIMLESYHYLACLNPGSQMRIDVSAILNKAD